MVIGMPWWAPAPPCHNAPTVSAVMYVRCSTGHSSWVIACNAASTFSRWRPEGALTNTRCQHQTIPRKGAKTKGAAAMNKTARRPDWASAHRGSTQFFSTLLGPPRPPWPGSSRLFAASSRALSKTDAPASACASSRSRLRFWPRPRRRWQAAAAESWPRSSGGGGGGGCVADMAQRAGMARIPPSLRP
jgi:hypothetical protein